MKLIFLLQTLILANIVFGHKNGHFKRNLKDSSLLERLRQNQDRNLENITPQKIRIKYDFSSLDNVQDPQTKDYFIKTLQFATQYFQDFIKVKQPISSPFKISEENKECSGLYNFTDIQMNTEYKDADLVIIATHDNDPEQPYVTYAIGCQQDEKTLRNIIGIVKFNTAYVINSNAYQFQQQLQTTIKQIFHIIVFDPYLFQFFRSSDGEIYDESKLDITFIKTPNVAKWAQDYYSCPTAEGMQLEDIDGEDLAGFYWKTSVLYGDTMSSSDGNTLWSGANNALLLDSGWYDVDLKYQDNPTWGKNKGCEFLEDKCLSNKQFKEFCQGEEEVVTFSYHAKGICFDFQYEPECKVVQYMDDERDGVKKSTICYDPSNYDQNAKYNEYYGYDSRAFLSTLKPASESPITQACYKYKCIDNNTKIQVTFGQETLTCSQNDETLKSKQNGIEGELTCPDIQDFCGQQSQCPNFCSANGYCVSGKCICQNGFSGDACDECEEGKVIQNGQCVSCGENCTVCSSVDPKKCSACKTDYFLSGEKCLLPCKSPCKTCSTAEDACLSCISNYYLSNNSCEQFTSDLNCDVPEDNSKCKICKSGKGLDSNGKCNITCSSNCKTCSEKADECTSCNDGSLLFDKKCVCEKGQFMNQNNQCEKCMPFCKECVKSQSCISCSSGYEITTQGICGCKQGEYMNDQNICVPNKISCNGCEEQNVSIDTSSNKLIYGICLIIALII